MLTKNCVCQKPHQYIPTTNSSIYSIYSFEWETFEYFSTFLSFLISHLKKVIQKSCHSLIIRKPDVFYTAYRSKQFVRTKKNWFLAVDTRYNVYEVQCWRPHQQTCSMQRVCVICLKVRVSIPMHYMFHVHKNHILVSVAFNRYLRQFWCVWKKDMCIG